VRPRRIVAAASFGEAVGRFPPEQQNRIKDAVRKFRDRSAENALRIEHKSGLHCWAFRVPGVSGARAFYVQRADEKGRYALLFHVGPHDDYYTVKRKVPR
jgi:hypothetical protein